MLRSSFFVFARAAGFCPDSRAWVRQAGWRVFDRLALAVLVTDFPWSGRGVLRARFASLVVGWAFWQLRGRLGC